MWFRNFLPYSNFPKARGLYQSTTTQGIMTALSFCYSVGPNGVKLDCDCWLTIIVYFDLTSRFTFFSICKIGRHAQQVRLGTFSTPRDKTKTKQISWNNITDGYADGGRWTTDMDRNQVTCSCRIQQWVQQCAQAKKIRRCSSSLCSSHSRAILVCDGWVMELYTHNKDETFGARELETVKVAESIWNVMDINRKQLGQRRKDLSR